MDGVNAKSKRSNQAGQRNNVNSASTASHLGSPSVAMMSATFCPAARSCGAMGWIWAIISRMWRHSGVPPSGLDSKACDGRVGVIGCERMMQT